MTAVETETEAGRRAPALAGERAHALRRAGKSSVGTIIAASMVGTTIEFYDFYAYGTAAANYFPRVFFSDATNPTVALLLSLVTFAWPARWARSSSVISATRSAARRPSSSH